MAINLRYFYVTTFAFYLIFMKKLYLSYCKYAKQSKARKFYDISAEIILFQSEVSLNISKVEIYISKKREKNHHCICLHVTRIESCN